MTIYNLGDIVLIGFPHTDLQGTSKRRPSHGGGVSLEEINPRTMESRIVHGLFFCGEMIDVDGMTGGYNLQAAFSTGYLAGESAAQIQ